MFDPNNMKEVFRKIVTLRLEEAPVGPAKGELIEELAENLTCRYNDMVASGVDAGEAESRALDALGDTAELVEYLKSLEPDQPLPELVLDPEKSDDGRLDDLLHNVEDLIRGALKKARTAISGAKENLKETLRNEDSSKASSPIGDKADLARIEAELDELSEKMIDLRGRIEDAEEALSELKETRDSLSDLSDKVDVTAALAEIEEKIAAKKAEITAMEAEYTALDEAYDVLNAQFGTLEDELEELEDMEDEPEDLEDEEADTVTVEGEGGWKFSMGFDSDKGKFYAGKDRDHGIEVGADDIKSGIKDLMKNIEVLVRDAAEAAQNAAGKAAETVRKAADTAADADLGDPVPTNGPIEGDQLRGISVETTGGDVTIRMTQPADGDVVIDGDPEELEGLEVFRTDDGVLTIRPVRTETFAFFSRRGMGGSSVDVTLDLPCRDWDFLNLRTTNGDVRITADRPIDRVSVHTVAGDVAAELGACPQVSCRTTGGDIRWTSQSAEFRAETISGDVRFAGRADSFWAKTTSGDVELEGAADSVTVKTVSGDAWIRDALLPQQLNLGTVSGDVKADLPDEGPFTVKFSSTSGDFRSDFFTGIMGGRSCQFAYQGGGSRIYTVSTVSGDLELRKYFID